MFFNEDDLLPISLISHFVFCERRAALHFTEETWQDNIYTIEGSHFHDNVDNGVRTESRKILRVARSLRLRSLRLGLTGVADVVEFHKMNIENKVKQGFKIKGADGYWQPFPVEYKSGHLRHEESYMVQLCAQALCLEEMLKVTVSEGAIFFGAPRKRLDIQFDQSLRDKTKAYIRKLHVLIQSKATPKAVYEKKCDSCSLYPLCIPKIFQRTRTVKSYIDNALELNEKKHI